MNDEGVTGVDAGQITQMMDEILRLRMRLKAFLPEEIIQVRRRLHEMPSGDQGRMVNHEVFFRIGRLLFNRGALTMGELSAAVSVPLSTATRTVDWLVDNGYAARMPDPADRRVVRVALTEHGRTAQDAMKNHVVQQFRQALSGLSPEEQKTFFVLFRKMIAALNKASP